MRGGQIIIKPADTGTAGRDTHAADPRTRRCDACMQWLLFLHAANSLGSSWPPPCGPGSNWSREHGAMSQTCEVFDDGCIWLPGSVQQTAAALIARYPQAWIGVVGSHAVLPQAAPNKEASHGTSLCCTDHMSTPVRRIIFCANVPVCVPGWEAARGVKEGV